MLEEKITVEKKKTGVSYYLVVTVVAILIVGFGLFKILYSVGHSKLNKNQASAGNNAATEIEKAESTYKLNEDIVTVLLMGIDNETVNEIGKQSWDIQEGTEYNGGQADALFLAVIDPHKEKVSLVAINRNSITDVDVFDEDGYYKGVSPLQVSLQHGYGDGKEESCERQVKTVSRMFNGIKINAYASISMDAVPPLADAVDGVPIVAIEDIVYPEYNMNVHVGDEINLKGETAYWYVRLRQEDEFNSNSKRLERQKQFLNAFIAKAKSACMEDLRVATDLYSTVQKYMVTDIDMSMFVYMASEYRGYSFDINNLYTLEGKTITGLSGFEEFYPDKDYLDNLILELFYEKTE